MRQGTVGHAAGGALQDLTRRIEEGTAGAPVPPAADPDARSGPVHLRVFLSSPGDVADERALARGVVERLGYDPFLRGRVTLECVAWDQPGAGAPMLATRSPQAAIDAGLPAPSACDVVVVVFWSRMGTPLPAAVRKPDSEPYASGTEYEYLDAIAAADRTGSPEVLLYRRDEEPVIRASDADARERLAQWERVERFFADLRSPDGSLRRGYNRYASPDDFARDLDHHLRHVVKRLVENREAETGEPLPVAGPPTWKGSPFPGLRAFDPAQAAIFFGRGRETDELIRRVGERDAAFVAVVGASGSGKSSLVRAGLLPRLAAGAVEGVARWITVTLRPGELGDEPALALAARLAPLRDGATETPRELASRWAADPDQAGAFAAAALSARGPGARLLLVVDQLEELFTLSEPRHREAFAAALARVAATAGATVVATLRADFYADALEVSGLAEALRRATFPLSAPRTPALREMIEGPAARAGLAVEDGLADRIVEDTGGAAGSLPLMAFALSELYEAGRGERALTHSAYEAFGGVRGALAERAESTWGAAPRASRDALGRVLRELVEVDEAGHAGRRRARLERLAEDADARALVEALVAARLLVTGRGGDPAGVRTTPDFGTSTGSDYFGTSTTSDFGTSIIPGDEGVRAPAGPVGAVGGVGTSTVSGDEEARSGTRSRTGHPPSPGAAGERGTATPRAGTAGAVGGEGEPGTAIGGPGRGALGAVIGEVEAGAAGRAADPDARAAVSVEDEGRGEHAAATVELAHEALLEHWPRCRAWLEDNRRDLRLRSRLAIAARHWREEGEAEDRLLRAGRPVEEARALLGRWRGALPGDTVRFVEASAAAVRRRAKRLRGPLGLRMGLNLAIVALFLAHTVGLARSDLLSRLEHRAYDARLALAPPPVNAGEVAVVAIDDEAVARHGWPFPREALARIVDRLVDELGARAVGLHATLADPQDRERRLLEALAAGPLAGDARFLARLRGLVREHDPDRRLASAIAGRPVVLGFGFAAGAGEPRGALPAPIIEHCPLGRRKGLRAPGAGHLGNIERLQAGAAGGYLDLPFDGDGVVRRVPLLYARASRCYGSFALALTRVALGNPPLEIGLREAGGDERLRLGGHLVPVDGDLRVLLPFAARPDTVSAARLLAHGSPPPQRLRGRIVLIGPTAAGLGTRVLTPRGRWADVEVQADLVAAMVAASPTAHLKRRTVAAAGGALVASAAIGIGLALALPFLGPLAAMVSSVALLAGTVLADLALWSGAGLAVPVAGLAAMILAVFVCNAAFGFAAAYRLARPGRSRSIVRENQ